MVPEDRAVRLEQMEQKDRRENVVTAEPAEETDLLELLVLPDRRVMWETADPMVSLHHKDPKENQVRSPPTTSRSNKSNKLGVLKLP